jgi:hypothetical protein
MELRKVAILSSATLAGCLAGVAIFYAYGDLRLLRWGAEALAATFVMACLALVARDVRVQPRSQRVELELKLAHFKARSALHLGGGTEAPTAHVRTACRLAWGTRRHSDVSQLLRYIEAAAPGEALALIADRVPLLIGPRAPRRPRTRPQAASPGLTLTSALVLAFLTVLVRPVLPHAHPWALGGMLQVGGYLALFWAGLALIKVVALRTRERFAKFTFNVLLVSRAQGVPDSEARTLYAGVGALIHLHIDDAIETEVAWSSPSGDLDIFAATAGAEYCLEAFASQVDLVVLASDDSELAARIRAHIGLPADRMLYLCSERKAPEGFLWTEPAALAALAAGRKVSPQTDLYLTSIPNVALCWDYPAFRALLVLGFLCVNLRGGSLLAAVFWLAAVSYQAPNIVGHWRRSAISRDRLSSPRAPAASRAMRPRRLEWRIRIGVFLLLSLPGLLMVQVPLSGEPDSGLVGMVFIKLAMSLPLLALIDFALVTALLIAIKWRLDWRFRILVLRRNAQRHGYGHKLAVMAGCGRYAQVISIRDDNLDLTDTGYGEHRESSLGYWFQVFSEMGATLVPSRFLHIWERQVRLELEVADFAVFDWIDEITDNMRWELEAAAERLPPHRLLIVHSRQNAAAVQTALDQLSYLLSTSPHCLETSRGPDDQFIWSRHDAFEQAFLDGLHGAVADLAAEVRPSFVRETPGAWPLPIRLPR